jgi:hypothetical protein
MKICIHISKLGLWVQFFVVIIIDIHQLNLKPFASFKFLVKNSYIYIYNFDIKEKYFMYFFKKPIPNEREKDFIVGYCIIFSNFFCLVMS